MCGIAGLISKLDASNASARDAVRRMTDHMRVRGPDAEGVWAGEDIILGHRRLAILDLDARANQPMVSNDGRYAIVFNGEIYNFRELRRELEADGVAFYTTSDTEVLLALFAREGERVLPRLRGMFAFAIWDTKTRELFMARDPYGIKPLYFYQSSELFLFASELRALLASDLVPRKLNQDGLASYLQFGSCQDPLTILEGVCSLLPGHCLTVKRSGNHLDVQQFSFAQLAVSASSSGRVTPNAFTPNDSDCSALTIGTPHAPRAEAVTQLRYVLEDSVRHHLVSDVPLGAFLSGGIDSSAVVALMSRVAGQRVKTFSVVFEESEFSEGEHAKLVARKFGTEHHEIMLSEPNLLVMLPRAFEAMDQPTMDGINTYVVSKAVRDAGVKVALSGLGGDELFAGYPSFRRAQQLFRLTIMPSAIRQRTSALGRSMLNDSARRRKFWDLVDSDCSPYAAYSLSRQLFSPSEIEALTRGQRSEVRDQLDAVRREALGVRRTDATNAIDSINAINNSQFEIRNPKSEIHADALPLPLSPLQHQDVINEVSRLELSGYMSNTLLRDTDQMSMAHALEVRVPFVDPAVVSFVLGLPGEWKVDGNRPKPLLVDALGDLLPEEIWKRRKMGFTLPFQKWMRAGLESEINRHLSDKNGLQRIGLNGDETGAIWAAFKNNPRQEPWSRPWALYVLKQWCERNRVEA